MSYYDFVPESREGKLGQAIYLNALHGRRGFRYDQLGIEDDDIWREIFEDMGWVALEYPKVHPHDLNTPLGRHWKGLQAMTTDPIKALVDLGPELERLMGAATATPWGNRGKLSDRIVGPDEKTIAEFVSQALGKNGDEQDEANAVFCTFIVNNTQTILAAIEALKPMADMVMVPREPTEEICNKLRAVLPELFDTSDDTLREIYIDMLAAAAPPASPAPVDGENA